MIYYLRAIRDLRNNKFLNAVTVVTIALSIMIVSAFLLFFINANQLVNSWKKGIPAQIRSRSQLPFRVILPEIPGRIDRNNISLDEADYVWLGLS